ncbi:zinc ribbon domain-containing protein YjdM [Thiocystis violascens]|uniref:Alkylphosphonate utilization operon protein PhnA n=1 Tax=Thiocystis violascens (strain ATCC 17096 / DSM 198 / 6111) TaxID=765911 RepID=I3YAT9_THIV6|nr:zinc ribbon domain-containing protein YjdM [Thiocystis violascens]AFL74107.1 alkylphosphonate utilization operon protein PhnA [Thiocystis violascens DSM 198]
MSSFPLCLQCSADNVYSDGTLYICPECGHEWPMDVAVGDDEGAEGVVRDANGIPLADGDTVALIKDLKVKGSSTTLKVGTKIKKIRLVGGDHEVDCKIDGGSFMLKACYLRKA